MAGSVPQLESSDAGIGQGQLAGSNRRETGVRAALSAVGATHSQRPKLRSLQCAQAAGRYDATAERARWGAADEADAAALRRSAAQLPPPPPPPAAAGMSSGGPLVQRLGSRASSCSGEPAAAAADSGACSVDDSWLEAEAGIAVPVRLVCAGAAAGSVGGAAAGAGAELLPGGFLPGQPSASSPERGAGSGGSSGSPGGRRRDTPPQHIAARHAQAAAAARREVREVLERRGGSAARLVLGGP